MSKRPDKLLLRFFRIQELLAREERRRAPEWLRVMRLKRLALVLRQRLEGALDKAAGELARRPSAIVAQ